MGSVLRQTVRSIGSQLANISKGKQLEVSPYAKNALLALRIAASNEFEMQQSNRTWRQQQLPFTALAEPQLESDSELRLTESAIERLRELTADAGPKSSFLRLTVEAGGCSGFSYKFDLDASLEKEDRVFEAGGVRLVTDDVSFEFVRGAKVDYTQELIKSAFEMGIDYHRWQLFELAESWWPQLSPSMRASAAGD